jgi:hypothetical protein
MMPPTPEADGRAAPEPLELPPNTLARLRIAGGWARFVAIVSFVLTGLAGMAGVAMLVVQAGQETSPAYFAGLMFPLLVVLVIAGGAASLTWRYGQDAVAFSARGKPPLAPAFRSLRQLLILWLIVVALATTWKIISVLAKVF